MSDFFYTLDIGEEHGRILQRIASYWGYEDVEEYASDLLCGAIREAETWLNSEIYKRYEVEIKTLQEIYNARNAKADKEWRKSEAETMGTGTSLLDPDDDIPF